MRSPARWCSAGSTSAAAALLHRAEAATLRALCDVLTAQDSEPRIPVINFVDEKYVKGELDGYQYADMPDDRDTWRLVARGLDEEAGERAGAAPSPPPAASSGGDRAAFADGELRGGAWEELNVKRAFGLSCASCCRAFTPTPGRGTRSASVDPLIPAATAASAVRSSSARAERGRARSTYDRDPVSGQRASHPRDDDADRQPRSRASVGCRPTTTRLAASTCTAAACRTSTGWRRYDDDDEVDLSSSAPEPAGCSPSAWPGRVADRDPRGRTVLASRRGLGLRRGRVTRLYWTEKRIIGGDGPDRDGQEQLRARRRRLDGPLRRLHPTLSSLRLRDPHPRRRRRRLADLLRGSASPLRARRARAAGRRPGLAVGRSAHATPSRPHPVSGGRRDRLAGRRSLRHRDAGRPGRHRQRHVRQPSALHLPRLLPAGLQGQRQGQPLCHPPARRARPRRRDPRQLHGGPRRDRRGQRRATGVTYVRERRGSGTASGPTRSRSAATRSRRPGCCCNSTSRGSRTGSATTRTRSVAT